MFVEAKGFMNEIQVIFDASFKFHITNTTPELQEQRIPLRSVD